MRLGRSEIKHPLRLAAIAAVFAIVVVAAPAPTPAEAAFPTQSFSTAPPLPLTYRAPVAATLADGRVLVAGEAYGSCPISCKGVIIFDPVLLTWTALNASANQQLAFATLTSLPDGRLLIAGGGTEGSIGGTVVARTSIFDPTTNQLTNVAPMANARQKHAAAVLPDGNVMVIGGRSGFDPNFTYLTSVEIYNPATNAWTPGPPTANAYEDIGAASLPDGDVLIFGSTATDPSPGVSERYDTSTGTWSNVGALYQNASGRTGVTLEDGRVMTMGAVFGASQEARIYDPSTGLWQAAAPMKGKRMQHSATLLPSGKIFVMGGTYFSGNIDTARVEVYDPALDSWTSHDMPPRQNQWGQAAALLQDGTVLAIASEFGGSGANTRFVDSYGLDSDGDGYNDMNEQFNGENSALFCSIKRADITYDGVVNVADIGRWAVFQSNSTPKVDRHDINGDGFMNPADQGLIASKYGQNIPACP